MSKVTFRDKSLIYYGPHPCVKCDPKGKKGTMVVKSEPGSDFTFDFVHGSQYPNHKWKRHVCVYPDVP